MTRRTKIILGISTAVLVGAVILVMALRRAPEETTRTVIVTPQTVRQDISFTGRLEAEQAAELGFEISGRVKDILVEVGEQVEAGQLLVALDPQSAELELSRAGADLAAAQYESFLTWRRAETDLDNAKNEQTQLIAQARQSVIDAKAEFDRQKEVYLQTERESGDSALTDTSLTTLQVKESAYNAAQKALTGAQATQKKTNATNQAAADIAQARYKATLQAAGNTPGLSALESSRRLAGVKVSQANIIAPFAGRVTEIVPSVGEIAPAASSVLTLQTTDQLQVTADVTESDAVNLAVGQPVSLTFDAFRANEEWTGEVVHIAPAAKFIEGVPTYEVTIQISITNTALKPGLSANVIAHAAEKSQVLAVPRRAIVNKEGQKLVRVKGADGFIAEEPVTIGLIGSDGTVEITSGLNEGAEVVVSQEEK